MRAQYGVKIFFDAVSAETRAAAARELALRVRVPLSHACPTPPPLLTAVNVHVATGRTPSIYVTQYNAPVHPGATPAAGAR